MTALIRALKISLLAYALAGLTGIVAAQGLPSPGAGLDDELVRRVVSHGPWPQPWRPDPTNGASGNATAIDLGRRLFFDARMSPSGRVSCSSCHRPELAWTDGRPRGIGVETGPRNTPSLLDVRERRRFGWTGAGDSLWAQTQRPLLDPGEMASSAQHVQGHIARLPDLAGAYAAVFGRSVGAVVPEVALADTAKVLAAYQETIVSGRTPFDDFRDALAAGDRNAAASYPPAARRGLALFVGTAGCNACHAGPAFTDDMLHDVGAGRRIRTPGLRNVARTAPYMHDGGQATLADAIRAHGSHLGHEVADLVAFIETLTRRVQ